MLFLKIVAGFQNISRPWTKLTKYMKPYISLICFEFNSSPLPRSSFCCYIPFSNVLCRSTRKCLGLNPISTWSSTETTIQGHSTTNYPRTAKLKITLLTLPPLQKQKKKAASLLRPLPALHYISLLFGGLLFANSNTAEPPAAAVFEFAKSRPPNKREM